MKDKICALIRQTWYETAKRNLTPSDRLRFYEICFEYEFNDTLPAEDLPFGAKLLFDMVKADIDQDKEKAAARADRARQNGAFGGRPKLTQDNTTDTNPVGFSETQKTPIYKHKDKYNNTTQQKESVREDEDTHTFFCVCLGFFERGCSAPLAEATKFWNYYEALGWKTKGGGDIIDRLALSKAWQLSDCSKLAMRRRAPYADLLRKSQATEVCLIADFVEMIRDAATSTIKIKYLEQSTALLFDHKYLKSLLQWLPTKEDGRPFEVEYLVIQNTLD